MSDAALFIVKRCAARGVTLFRGDGPKPLGWLPANALTAVQIETLRENREDILAVLDAMWHGKFVCPWCKQPVVTAAGMDLLNGDLAHHECVLEVIDCLFGRAA